MSQAEAGLPSPGVGPGEGGGSLSAEGLRVCFVDSYLKEGDNPIPKQSELLARALEGLGAEVILTSPVVNRPLRVADIALTLIRRRGDYDTVCIQAYRKSFALAVLATLVGEVVLGKRSVVVLRGGKLPELWGRRPAPVRWTFRRADALVSPSGYLDEALGGLGFQGVVIPNCIEIEDYTYRERPAPGPRMLWLRAFHRIYNPQLALRTLARVREDHPAATLTMAGPDVGELAACRELAQELGVAGAVAFPGFVEKEEIPELADRHDVFLNTSRMDNVPVTVIEALAAGLCVVSTDVDGIPYLLDHGRDGLLVPSDDLDAMAGAVMRILEEPELARCLSAGARRKAEGFDVSAVMPRWISILTADAP